MVFRTTGNLSTVSVASASATGPSRLLAMYDPDDGSEVVVLSCGTGWGRPRCELRHPGNLSVVGDSWIATGVIPRTEAGGYGLLVANGSVYSARYQSALPGRDSSDANVITRSELSATDDWTYRYNELSSSSNNENNGLYRSVNLRSRSFGTWLAQPGADSHQTVFTKPWTKAPSDPYVYFGLYEYAQGSYYSRIARVCKEEGSTVPTRNNFNTFLKMEISCDWNRLVSRGYSVSKLTASASGAGSSPWLYMAFSSPGGEGSAICAFSYAASPGGIDYEMGGMIDTEITDTFFWSGAARFSCDRTADDAEEVFYVHPENQEEGFDGEADSTRVTWVQDGSSAEVAYLAVHTELFGRGLEPMDVLWTINTQGQLSKIAVQSNRSLPGTVVQHHSLDVMPTVLTVDEASASVLVGSATAVISVPFDSCAQHQTCSDCVAPGDPYCGWCSETASCGRSADCSTDTNVTWHHSLFGNDDGDCPGQPPTARVQLLATQATGIRLLVEIAGEVGGDSPEVVIYVNGSETVIPIADDSFPAIRSITDLLPFSTYMVRVTSRSSGGRTGGNMFSLTTAQAAPAQVGQPNVSAVNSSCLALSWLPPVPTHGVVHRYTVTRNGSSELVCCDGAEETQYLDCGLAPYVVYAYHVNAVTGNQAIPLAGSFSGAGTARTLGIAPSLPRNVAVDATNTTATVVWDAPEAPNGPVSEFAVYMDGSRVWRSLSERLSRRFVAENLQPNTRYNFSVQAVSEFGVSAVSEPVVVATLVGLPPRLPIPTVQSLSYDQSSAIVVQWQPEPDFPVDSYQLERVNQDSTTTMLYNGTGTNTTLDQLASCQLHYFGVKAVTASGAGELSHLRQLRTGSSRPPEMPAAPWLLNRAQGTVALQLLLHGCDAVGYHLGQRVASASSAYNEVHQNLSVGDGIGNMPQTVVLADILDETSYEFATSEVYLNSDGTMVRGPWSDPFELEPFELSCTVSTTPAPTVAPTTPAPTVAPTTPAPTEVPTSVTPTQVPTTASSLAPSPTQTPAPTDRPTPSPTVLPTVTVTSSPTLVVLCSTLSTTIAMPSSSTTTASPATDVPTSPAPSTAAPSTAAPTARAPTIPDAPPSPCTTGGTTTTATLSTRDLASTEQAGVQADGSSSAGDTDQCTMMGGVAPLVTVAILAALLFVLALALWLKLRRFERAFGQQATSLEKANGSYKNPVADNDKYRNSMLILDPLDVSVDGLGYLDIAGLDDEGNAMAMPSRPTSSVARNSLLDSEHESQAKLDGALHSHTHDNMLADVTFGTFGRSSQGSPGQITTTSIF